MDIGGWSLIGLFILASLFIIVNTIRLTVIARGEEISIMQLVGATNRFIKGPFLIEGFIIGIVGATLAVGLLYFIYAIVINQLVDKMPFFLLSQMNPLYTIFIRLYCYLGQYWNVRRYISVSRSLKVR